MNITDWLSCVGGTWTIRDMHTGKVYQLSGVTLPERVNGLQGRVVGVIEDSFGLGLLHNDAVLRVQHWKIV